MLVTGTWLTLLFFGPGDLWLGALLVGYVVVLPIAEILFGEDDESSEESKHEPTPTQSTDDEQLDPLEELRQRYARGELTDEQFERKVERLLETETIEDVEDAHTPSSVDKGQEPATSAERARETEFE